MPSTGTLSRSTTTRSTPSSPSSSPTPLVSCTTCPAAPSVASIRLANIRSGATARMRATLRPPRRSQAATAAKVPAHALRPAPHLDDLGPPLVNVPDDQLAIDALAIQELESPLHRLGRGGVAKAMRDQQSEVPVGLRIRLRVHLREQDSRVDVALLVGDPEVQLEIGPIVRERVDNFLKGLGERHPAEKPRRRRP